MTAPEELNTDDLEMLSDTQASQKYNGNTVIENTIIDTGRWTHIHRVVFEGTDGALWAFEYQTGATEMQDIDFPDYVTKPYRVEAVPTTIMVYKKVPS